MGKIEYGKRSITEVQGNKLVEVSQSIVGGSFVAPKKVHTEESIEIRDRADQDEEYIRFADEEQRLYEAGKLVEAEFQIRRTGASANRGTRYVIKKFTILDKGSEYKI